MKSKIIESVYTLQSFVGLIVALLILTSIPALVIFFAIGDSWQGITPTFSDELNFARISGIGNGHITNGNGYFLEHADGPPLVIFGGAWLNAIPLWFGIPFNASLAINFISWSLLFGVAAYWLFIELRIRPWWATLGAVFLYIQSYWHVWRPANLQPVYPFYFLYYIAFLRFVREQSRANSIFLALTIGTTFYVFAYLWQIAVITMGLLFIYAIIIKDWKMAKATFSTSFLGGLIGLPVPLYMLWLSHTSPFFWESMGRLGLVTTHIPMAEVIYSGGWIAFMFALMGLLFWQVRELRADKEFSSTSIFFLIHGAALGIMISSNIITGKLLETGEHVRTFIFPLTFIALMSCGMYFWKYRQVFSRVMRFFLLSLLGLLLLVNIQFAYHSVESFFPTTENQVFWQENQLFAGPFNWLQKNEKESVVVWSNPKNYLGSNLPMFTRHFLLYQNWGMYELLSDKEVLERYLISQYFENVTVDYLEDKGNMIVYLGRGDYAHKSKTIEREIKVCRIVFFWNKNHDCGIPPTSQDVLGEKFFEDLETAFHSEIKPNIYEYLQKYQVSYILKDTKLDLKWTPETLNGTKKVYDDERYEMYSIEY